MRRSNQLNPMRSLILLAVVWVAGSLLFAAEQTPSPTAKPAQQAQSQNRANAGAVTNQPGSTATSSQTSEAAADEDAADESRGVVAQVDAGTDEEADASSEDEASAPPPVEGTAADKATGKSSPQRFVPSEQVRADFDVSFPIDI